MREILLYMLLMFSASLFACEDATLPDGWYTVDAGDVVGVDELTAHVPAVPERLSGSAVEQTNATQTTTDTVKLIGEPSCCFIGAFEVGWRN